MTADHTVQLESVPRTERYLMSGGHVIDVTFFAVDHDGQRRALVLDEAQRLWPVPKGANAHRIVGVTTLPDADADTQGVLL